MAPLAGLRYISGCEFARHGLYGAGDERHQQVNPCGLDDEDHGKEERYERDARLAVARLVGR